MSTKKQLLNSKQLRQVRIKLTYARADGLGVWTAEALKPESVVVEHLFGLYEKLIASPRGPHSKDTPHSREASDLSFAKAHMN